MSSWSTTVSGVAGATVGDPVGGGVTSDMAPKLATNAERFRWAFEDSAIGMSIEDLDGRFVQVNPVLCSMLGYTSTQLVTMSYQDVCHPDDLEGPEYLESLGDGSVRQVMRECRHIRSDGTVIWVRVHVGVVRDQGKPLFYIAQTEDITGRKDAESRLIHQARHDTLTGLLNRRAFTERVSEALMSGEELALLFVDLDRFKLVNDTLGHPTGDELLIAVARRLQAAVGGRDVVARLGGDEFVVLVLGVTCAADAEPVAERLQAALAAPFGISGRSLFVTASIGIALPGESVATAEDTLRAADLAMYRAKTTAVSVWSRISTARSPTRNRCACGSSRWCPLSPVAWRASKPSSAGSIRGEGCCYRANSFPSPRRRD
jgi:diguanylate cyclase (GGDEF)-like protein/PAS domain S-box-containing protein